MIKIVLYYNKVCQKSKLFSYKKFENKLCLDFIVGLCYKRKESERNLRSDYDILKQDSLAIDDVLPNGIVECE